MISYVAVIWNPLLRLNIETSVNIVTVVQHVGILMPPHEIEELLEFLNSHISGQKAQTGVVNYKCVRLVCLR